MQDQIQIQIQREIGFKYKYKKGDWVQIQIQREIGFKYKYRGGGVNTCKEREIKISSSYSKIICSNMITNKEYKSLILELLKMNKKEMCSEGIE